MKRCGKQAPHKALLLLSVIDLIERGYITTTRIELTDVLERQFKRNTTSLLGESILFQPKINYPYVHMHSESFWELIPTNGGQIEKFTNYSTSSLRQNIAYAQIDKELFELLQNPNARAKLRVLLISTYLNDQPTIANKLKTIIISLGYITAMIA